eukprot:gene8381-9956_t
MESNSSPVDRQVLVLTQRVTAAEEQIRQLIELTNSMRNEIASQQRIINAFTTISAERKLSNSKTTLPQFVSDSATPKVVDNSLLNTFETGNPTLDTWDFESMDLDWDSLNVSAMNSSTNVTIPESVPVQTITTTSVPSHKHSRDESTDNDYPQNIKAMRYDSLDRILAYTVQASAVSDKNILKIDTSINYDEDRLATSKKIFRYMNVGDMNALSKLVSESFCESMSVQFCQMSESVCGKAEAMMLFSLLYESYPDGMWKLISAEVNNKVVTVFYTFTGTSVFDTPLSLSFKQVKEHEQSLKGTKSSEQHAGNQIVRNVAEMAANTHHQQGSLNATSAAALSTPAGLPANQIASNTRSRSFTSYAYPAPSIALPRKSVGQIEIDLTGFSIYDRTNTPRSSDMDDNVDPSSAKSVVNSTSSGKEAEVDIIKIPRSKGNESFRVEASRTGTLQPPSAANSRPTSIHRAPSLNSELIASALIKKSEFERRKCEITFNDYNLIVHISVTACPR